MRNKIILIITLLIFLTIPGSALAQNLSFYVELLDVHAIWNEDGTLSLDYLIILNNSPTGAPIDYVDIGLPNKYYDLKSVYAEIDEKAIDDIQHSDYLPPGVSGIALGLGANTIQPGERGTLWVYIGKIERVLYPDTTNEEYASVRFATTYLDRKFVLGQTETSVTFHLPPGIQPDEPRWHIPPSGWPSEPITGTDEQGRITYTWTNVNANAYTPYEFGASFPKTYIPESAIVTSPATSPVSRINFEDIIGGLIPVFCIGFVGLFIVIGLFSDRKRKMQYLPPKISIEGHGIKRGLTAVEAGIIMEQQMDKIMTMILFALLKKNAARVITRDPLELEITEPQPDELHPYEQDFLLAFMEPSGAARQKALQDMMVNLVKSVSQKMKGFSHRETVAYYQEIMKRAWEQVESSDTPEVKSENYDKVMEWTMLDRDYERRTKDVFRGGPVFVPMWWQRFDPGYGRTSAPSTTAAPAAKPVSLPQPSTGAGGQSVPSLPHLPGSDFAASVVKGAQSFSGNIIGNLSEFTSGITQRTNPPPPPRPSSSSSLRGGGGGSSCACACACAGCACACAGGGR
jgi:hypothetical protein